MKEKTKLWKKK